MNCIYCNLKMEKRNQFDYPETYYECFRDSCCVLYIWYTNKENTEIECVEFKIGSQPNMNLYIMHKDAAEVCSKIKGFGMDIFISVEKITKDIFLKKKDSIELLG